MLRFFKNLFKALLVLIILSGFGVLGYLSYAYSKIHSETDKLVHYEPQLSTRIFDRNGELIANIFDKEHRIYVPYDDIPARVIEALIAIEDTMFYEHMGINIEAILRAIIKDIKAGKLVEGASTLTQQVVKTKLLTREKKISRKIKEILIALKLETILTKEEILERYLNEVYFGHGYYGIRTASLGYFRKELSELSIKEIAMLVGLPKAPSYYDPTKNFEFSLGRANKVLYRMNKLGWLQDREFEEALLEKPIVYNDTLTKNRAPYVVDAVIKQFSANIDDLRSGGYKFYLTIDLNTQDIARDALKFGYEKVLQRDKDKKYSKSINGAIVAMESSTGHILALVGGTNYKDSSFNRAIQSRRQPGSSVKPFIYQVALDSGYSPYSQIADIARTYEYTSGDEVKKWQPKNYEKNFEGLVELREALIHSRNLATINLVNDLGLDNVHSKLKSIGFNGVPYDLSISLGSFGASPLQMSQYYSIFSNYGTMVYPMLIQKVENRHHQAVEFHPQREEILNEDQAYLMIDILRDIPRRGTARLARVKGLETAGKTGTTNNYIDAWFCGFSPTIQTVVWYGNDDNKPMKRGETGGRTSAPAFSYFFTKLLETSPELKRKFDVPDGVKEMNKKIYTDISPLPQIKKSTPEDSNLIF
jgi:penicillin-binding protein 1A